ncbi:MetS family NSS transporter small subunit [Geoglobus sp.]
MEMAPDALAMGVFGFAVLYGGLAYFLLRAVRSGKT